MCLFFIQVCLCCSVTENYLLKGKIGRDMEKQNNHAQHPLCELTSVCLVCLLYLNGRLLHRRNVTLATARLSPFATRAARRASLHKKGDFVNWDILFFSNAICRCIKKYLHATPRQTPFFLYDPSPLFYNYTSAPKGFPLDWRRHKKPPTAWAKRGRETQR